MYERGLIVGSGGREHAIGWKINKDSLNNDNPVRLFFAPGNGGTSEIGRNVDIEPTDISRLVNFASDNNLYVIFGSEAPLALGGVNAMNEAGVQSFGPTQEAARLESSKAFAIGFMRRHGIPHPDTFVFDSFKKAENYVSNIDPEEIVIKADGLAGGKGVLLPKSKEGALITLRDMMITKESFGEAGSSVLVQKRLKGNEVSIMAFVSESAVVMLPTARDYKRLMDGDLGPNTGGMGAYSPNDNLTQDDLAEIYHGILVPTQKGMAKEGRPFKGLLYAGIMMTHEGPKVIEYNVRFGDPETQVQLPRLRTPLLPLMKATMNGRLKRGMVKIDPRHSAGVVIASEGYPHIQKNGKEVYVSKDISDEVLIFHGGTRNDGESIKSTGGRILTVVSLGESKEEARNNVYDAIEENAVWVDGGINRWDIAS